MALQLQRIVDEYVDVSVNADSVNETDQSRRFDISRIDFERLRQEFALVKNKRLLMKDLSELVEERLTVMMSRNPLRINYYERYRKIIEEYNSEQDSAAIEKTFIDLTNLVNDLSTEDKRYIREGFESDEELAMYDLLLKDSLASSEIKKIKRLAKALLKKVKEKISELDSWREKEETRAVIDNLIRDTLYKELPESYDESACTEYRRKIYEFVYSTYQAA